MDVGAGARVGSCHEQRCVTVAKELRRSTDSHSKTLARDKLRGREALPKPSHVPSAAKIRLRSHYSYL
jgi:hypothetical protein